MMLLDLLLRIETIETQAEKESFAIGLYKTNRKFARLCDLAYRKSIQSRYVENGKKLPLPTYKQDNVPYGYNYAQLEIIYNKLSVSGFISHNSKRVLDEKIATTKLVQVFESLSDVECRFVAHLLHQDIPWFTRDAWIKAKHS